MCDAPRPSRLAVGLAPREVDFLAGHADGSGSALEAAEYLEKLGLAISSDPGDAQDLAAAHVQVDAFQPFDAIVVLDLQILDDKHPGLGCRRFLLDAQQHLPAHHQLRQFFGARGAGLDRGGHLAAPHHADGVGDLHDFAQLVRDQNDGLPFGLQAFENAKQVIRLGGRQNACRLVQDQDVRLAVERLQDLDPLLVPHRQIFDPRVRVDAQLVVLGELGEELPRLAKRGFQPGALLGAQNDVLENREILDQLEVLEHHTDPGRDRRLAVGDLGFLAVDEDLAFVGLIEAVEDRHQRRFPRAILADNAVNRAGHDPDRDVFVGLNRPESFRDAR